MDHCAGIFFLRKTESWKHCRSWPPAGLLRSSFICIQLQYFLNSLLIVAFAHGLFRNAKFSLHLFFGFLVFHLLLGLVLRWSILANVALSPVRGCSAASVGSPRLVTSCGPAACFVGFRLVLTAIREPDMLSLRRLLALIALFLPVFCCCTVWCPVSLHSVPERFGLFSRSGLSRPVVLGELSLLAF